MSVRLLGNPFLYMVMNDLLKPYRTTTTKIVPSKIPPPSIHAATLGGRATIVVKPGSHDPGRVKLWCASAGCCMLLSLQYGSLVRWSVALYGVVVLYGHCTCGC